MTFFETINASSTLAALGWAVLHAIWQGLVIGVVTWGALFLLRHRSPQSRYVASCVGMTVFVLAFAATFVVIARTGRAPVAAGGVAIAAAEPEHPFVPYVSWVWLVGAILMVTRTTAQWRFAQRLRTMDVSEVDPSWRTMFETLCADLGATRAARVMRSGAAEVPMVIGWLSPVVLVPTMAFSSLSPDQLRAILAHEIAHIRRHDYLVNCLQKAVEAVLFFHPVTWWLSRRIRTEREHCCDDVAVAVTGNPLTLANALSRLETLRANEHELAVAASGGSLMDRIKRIVGAETTRPRTGWIAAGVVAVALTLGTAGIAIAAASSSEGDPPKDKAAQAKAKEALEAIAKALEVAVYEGAISEKDARLAFSILTGSEGKASHEEQARRQLAEVAAALEEEVAAGRISAEQAEKKLHAIKAEMHARLQAKAELEDVHAQMRVMLEAGEITREEAERRLREIEVELDRRMQVQHEMQQVALDLEAAVKAGHLTAAEAKKKLVEIEARMAEEPRHWNDGRSDQERMEVQIKRELQDVARQLEIAVEAGELSELEAARHLAEMEARANERITVMQHRRSLEAEFRAVAEDIEKQLEAGRLSKEEAREELRRIELEMQEHAEKIELEMRMRDMEHALQRIHELVDAGEISKADAEKKIAELEHEIKRHRRR